MYADHDAPRGAGEHLFTWDGEKTNGETAADGVYTIEIEADERGRHRNHADHLAFAKPLWASISPEPTPVVITPSGTRELGHDPLGA